MRKALEGIKVIQLANFIAAAATGRYLADHGADVILVESPTGDPIRYTQEQEGRPQNIKENVCWEYLNGNKRCISINTKTEEGKEALFKLLDGADVLLTNWRLGALQRAGRPAPTRICPATISPLSSEEAAIHRTFAAEEMTLSP